MTPPRSQASPRQPGPNSPPHSRSTRSSVSRLMPALQRTPQVPKTARSKESDFREVGGFGCLIASPSAGIHNTQLSHTHTQVLPPPRYTHPGDTPPTKGTPNTPKGTNIR